MTSIKLFSNFTPCPFEFLSSSVITTSPQVGEMGYKIIRISSDSNVQYKSYVDSGGKLGISLVVLFIYVQRSLGFTLYHALHLCSLICTNVYRGVKVLCTNKRLKVVNPELKKGSFFCLLYYKVNVYWGYSWREFLHPFEICWLTEDFSK